MKIRETGQGRKNTKEKILEAAIELFSERGVSAVSVRDITKAVGIKESALYNHYKSKDALLDDILEKFMNEFGKRTFSEDKIESQLNELGPELFLNNCILDLREKLTPTVQKMWKIVYMEQFRDQRARNFVIHEIMNRPAAFYEKAFRLMLEKEMIRPLDPKLLSDEHSYALLSMSYEHMLLRTDGKDTLPVIKKMFAHCKFFYENIKK